MLLLYGPPGCGKTSLCKALAQKIAARAFSLLRRPCTVKLVEVNCHSLFSKWFSESGKKIMAMFKEIRRLAGEPNTFVCLLIGTRVHCRGFLCSTDEIESITISRSSLFKGSEPSDSIRAVNVLLTQIDALKETNRVLILTTSNLLETVDPAFLDRIDLKFRLGQPGSRAKYEILVAGIQELMSKGLLDEATISSHAAASVLGEADASRQIMGLIEERLGSRSGRSLRKLPFLALTRCLKVPRSCPYVTDKAGRCASSRYRWVCL